jgi:hypothetical protein
MAEVAADGAAVERMAGVEEAAGEDIRIFVNCSPDVKPAIFT